MVFADVDVERNGSPVGRLSPAKFIYKASPEAPSTEVARHITAKNDLYIIIGMANPQTKVASFQMHVNHLISFIWFGVSILIIGAIIAMWPDLAFEEAGSFSYVRSAGAVATSVIFGLLLASGAGSAYAAPRGLLSGAHVTHVSPIEMPAPTTSPPAPAPALAVP